MSKERSKPVHVFGGPDYEVSSLVICFLCKCQCNNRLFELIWKRKIGNANGTVLMKNCPVQ